MSQLKLPVPDTDAARWRQVALQAIRAADMLAAVAIDRMDRDNEQRVNEALVELQSVPDYWQLARQASGAA